MDTKLMSLPPTSTKGSADSTPVTTFQINAPNIPITHSGIVATIGTIPIAGGGTGQVTKAAAFDALQPMTTGGDIIYGGASGTGTRLANGTAGQVLTSAGGTSAPTWSSASIITAWASATVTGSFSTNTTYACKSRRVGDSKEYMVVVTFSGAPDSVNFTLTLPSGDTIDTAKLPTTTSSDGTNLGPILGTGELMDTGNQSWGTCVVAYFSSTQVTMYSVSESLTGNGKTKIVAFDTPFAFGNTDKIALRFTVPLT